MDEPAWRPAALFVRISAQPAGSLACPDVAENPPMWDVFISHAAEDKDAVARPLADALSRAGCRVWYDELTLSVGDSLSRSIDRGLAESRYGIVVLSPHFLAKEWPRRELDGLTVREVSSGKVILKNNWRSFAPSTFAASYSSCGTLPSPTRNTTIWKPR